LPDFYHESMSLSRKGALSPPSSLPYVVKLCKRRPEFPNDRRVPGHLPFSPSDHRLTPLEFLLRLPFFCPFLNAPESRTSERSPAPCVAPDFFLGLRHPTTVAFTPPIPSEIERCQSLHLAIFTLGDVGSQSPYPWHSEAFFRLRDFFFCSTSSA